NPDRSEGPWGRGTKIPRMVVLGQATVLDTDRGVPECHGGREWRMQNGRHDTWTPQGKAPASKPGLKPDWGKPAVRNFRGDHGNVGIIEARSAPWFHPVSLRARTEGLPWL